MMMARRSEGSEGDITEHVLVLEMFNVLQHSSLFEQTNHVLM
jgi:hypothetical protein